MPDLIISDTSCLIILSKIDELELLQKLYNEIIITPKVSEEYGKTLPKWIKTIHPTDQSKLKILELMVDAGEASIIALALENPNSVLVLDDQKARKLAFRLKLKITGTLGIIVKAKLTGEIPSVKPILKKIKATDFRINPELEKMVLKEAKEL